MCPAIRPATEPSSKPSQMTGRWYLNTAPWWVVSLFFGMHIGATFWVLDFTSWRTTVIIGVTFGAIGGPIHALLSRRERSILGPISPKQYRLARRASWRGPVPRDPRTRRLAHQMAVLYLTDMTPDVRGYDLFFSGTFLVGTSIAAIMASGYYWLATAIFAVEFAFALWSPLLFGRRIDLLRTDTDTATTGPEGISSP